MNCNRQLKEQITDYLKTSLEINRVPIIITEDFNMKYHIYQRFVNLFKNLKMALKLTYSYNEGKLVVFQQKSNLLNS